MYEHNRSRIMRSWSVPANCGILGDRKSATLAHRRRMTYACAHTVQWCAVAPEASQFPWRQELCDASAPLLLRTRTPCSRHASAHLRGRAGPSPLFLTSPLHRQRARGAASAGAKAAATRAAPLVLPRPPPQPTRRGSALTKHGARRVGRHTRGPAYPDIDIGASQTDSALMRGTAAGEGPARPRRCQCPRVKRIATRDVFV